MAAPLIVITGTSASGKTTIVQELLTRNLVDAVRLVTCTTRPPRPEEKDGESYWFMSKEDFETELSAGGFFEHAEVYGRHYGSSRHRLEALLAQDKPVLAILDVQGAQTVRGLYPQTKVIFIDAPDDMLKRRLETRSGDPADLQKRLDTVAAERQTKPMADALIESLDGALEASVQATAEAVRRLAGQSTPPPSPVA